MHKIGGIIGIIFLLSQGLAHACGGGGESFRSSMSSIASKLNYDLSNNVEEILSGISDFISPEEIDAAVALAEWSATSSFAKSAVRILGRGLDFYTTAEKAAEISLAFVELSNSLKFKNRQAVAAFFSEDKSAEQIAEELRGMSAPIALTDQVLVVGLRSKGLTEKEIEKTYYTMLVMAYAKEQGY